MMIVLFVLCLLPVLDIKVTKDKLLYSVNISRCIVQVVHMVKIHLTTTNCHVLDFLISISYLASFVSNPPCTALIPQIVPPPSTPVNRPIRVDQKSVGASTSNEYYPTSVCSSVKSTNSVTTHIIVSREARVR